MNFESEYYYLFKAEEGFKNKQWRKIHKGNLIIHFYANIAKHSLQSRFQGGCMGLQAFPKPKL